VYDITNKKSFEALDKWKEDFLLKATRKDVPFILLGNLFYQR